MAKYREAVVAQAEKWLGLKATDKSNAIILSVYNSNKPLPRGYKVKHGDNWCATFASAVFIAVGYTDIFPVECSCGQLIEKAKKMGIWVENDAYVPKVGDCLLYDWDDNGKGDDSGWPEHIGIVTYVNKDSGYMVITEGNYSKSVKKRTVNINGRYIRGYVTPKFNGAYKASDDTVQVGGKTISTVAHEVIAGQWGSGDARRKKLAAAGYNYTDVQNEVNRILNTPSTNVSKAAVTKNAITTNVRPTSIDAAIAGNYRANANLYLREGAGTNKKAMVKMPIGTEVICNGYYTKYNGVRWYYITAIVNGIAYTGFSCSTYLRR